MSIQEPDLVTIAEFAKIYGKSETRIRTIISKNKELFPKPRVYGRYIAGGRTAHRFSLESLNEFMRKVKEKPKAKRVMKSDWEHLF